MHEEHTRASVSLWVRDDPGIAIWPQKLGLLCDRTWPGWQCLFWSKGYSGIQKEPGSLCATRPTGPRTSARVWHLREVVCGEGDPVAAIFLGMGLALVLEPGVERRVCQGMQRGRDGLDIRATGAGSNMVVPCA
jgi:hypothetical protein